MPAAARTAAAHSNWSSTPDAFAALVREIDRNLAALGDALRPARAEAARRALAAHLGEATLLDGMRCVLRSRAYSRVLLHADPAGRFSVLGLVWPPGSRTPVHGHYAWCAFGLHSGALIQETYDAWAPGDEAPRGFLGARELATGEPCCDASDGAFVHRLANRSRGLAMSLHVYGVPAARIEDGVNRVLGA
ncbi:MAG: cysteine dioxygenase family protein [Burkholderiales bacterium]|nr:cysteine dioxygenase family protein [Burkholderiales bacterium]